MAKFTAKEWDDIRKRFHNSIMADTSLSSLAQNLDTADWPVKGEEEKPSKYIDFNYDELLLLPEIAGSEKRADHLIGILKETLAFDDPFGDMVAQVEESASKENPVLKTLGRLGIPEAYPLALVNLTEGTRTVCASEGVKTIGEFANLAQQMSTRVVIGGDFRALLNALSHGDEEGIGQFLPFRKGASGLHLPEALGLAAGSVTRPEQLALARAYGAPLAGAAATPPRRGRSGQGRAARADRDDRHARVVPGRDDRPRRQAQRRRCARTRTRRHRRPRPRGDRRPLLPPGRRPPPPLDRRAREEGRLVFAPVWALSSRRGEPAVTAPREPAPPGPSFPPPPFPKPPSFAPPPGVPAPKPAGGARPLVLPRRASPLLRAQEAAAATTAATAEARKSIDAIISQSRAPGAAALRR
ncbi:hypothetical protein [Oleiharenicola sp. Vm1]|uniref:hypothetical protein n=1 Tax=Oleiharenicola sp. Vm1 TaxID=3398393 RepID=UPI0039F5A841